MTLEELRAEADKMGYKLTKKPERMAHCKCGTTRRCKQKNLGDYLIRICPECGFSVSVPIYNDQSTPKAWVELKKEWNRVMSDDKEM